MGTNSWAGRGSLPLADSEVTIASLFVMILLWPLWRLWIHGAFNLLSFCLLLSSPVTLFTTPGGSPGVYEVPLFSQLQLPGLKQAVTHSSLVAPRKLCDLVVSLLSQQFHVENGVLTLAGVAQWVEHWPVN